MRKERISRKARVVICAIEDTSTVIPQLAQNTNYYTWENTKNTKEKKKRERTKRNKEETQTKEKEPRGERETKGKREQKRIAELLRYHFVYLVFVEADRGGRRGVRRSISQQRGSVSIMVKKVAKITQTFLLSMPFFRRGCTGRGSIRGGSSNACSEFFGQNSIELCTVDSFIPQERTGNRNTGRTSNKRERTETAKVFNLTCLLGTQVQREGGKLGILQVDLITRIKVNKRGRTTSFHVHGGSEIKHIVSVQQEGNNTGNRVMDIKDPGGVDTHSRKVTTQFTQRATSRSGVVYILVL
jgi:hypothetical protein